MNAFNDQALVDAHYASSDPLAVRIYTHERYTEPAVNHAAWVLDHIPWTGRERVIDVGCGTGSYVDPTQARAKSYVAADRSLTMLRELGARVQRVNLDAQALPLRTASADVVMANHMLYHVPDANRAVREMRRVLRPGGWLLAATNSRHTMQALHDVMVRAAALCGAAAPERLQRSPIGFTLENGAALFMPHFRDVRRADLDTALIFRSASPVLAYVNSMRQVTAAQLTDVAWPDFERALSDLIEAEIAAHGDWRVPKRSGVFVCR